LITRLRPPIRIDGIAGHRVVAPHCFVKYLDTLSSRDWLELRTAALGTAHRLGRLNFVEFLALKRCVRVEIAIAER
jgi:hypothetical protein